MKTIVIANIDDWQALYGVDGQCVVQRHALEDVTIFNYLKTVEEHPKNIDLQTRWYDDNATVNGYAAVSGCLPETLAELNELEEAENS